MITTPQGESKPVSPPPLPPPAPAPQAGGTGSPPPWTGEDRGLEQIRLYLAQLEKEWEVTLDDSTKHTCENLLVQGVWETEQAIQAVEMENLPATEGQRKIDEEVLRIRTRVLRDIKIYLQIPEQQVP